MSAVLLLTVIGVAPAQAGGPTSVLLSAPGIPKVVATGYYDKSYEELTLLVDGSQGSNVPDLHSTMIGPSVRATWLIHDLTVWRVTGAAAAQTDRISTESLHRASNSAEFSPSL